MFLVMLLPTVVSANCSVASAVNACSNVEYPIGVAIGLFILDLLYVLIAMIFWVLSPVGILFFIALKLFFSKNPSLIKMKIALILQNLSFLTWFSVMLLLFFLYLDSVIFQIFNLGGLFLTLAIKSGIGFMIFMLVVVYIEKKNIARKKEDIKKTREEKIDEKEDEDGSLKKNATRKAAKSVKSKPRGIKQKMKDVIKEDFKEIIDNEIDKL